MEPRLPFPAVPFICSAVALLLVPKGCTPDSSSRDLFGRAVCAVGDVDRDGHADFAVSDRAWRSRSWSDWSWSTRGGYGAVWIVSGRDRAPIRRIEGHVPGTNLGVSLTSEDVDGDGALDLVLVSKGWTRAVEDVLEVRSGRTAGVLIELCSPFSGPVQFTLTDDVDHDGLGDVLVADRSRDGGRVLLVSSATGALLAECGWESDGPRFGSLVLAHADLDGDGLREIALGATSTDGRTPGWVNVRSGRDLGLLATWRTMQVPYAGSLVAVDDLNTDGIPDLALAGSSRPIAVHSGADGSLLFTTSQRFADRHVLAPIGDCNGDGTPDLVVGDIDIDLEGAAFVLSGRDGSTLGRIRPEGIANSWFGSSVAGCGDVDRDGVGDIVVGVGCPFGNAEAGAVAVYSGRTREKLLQVIEEDLLR